MKLNEFTDLQITDRLLEMLVEKGFDFEGKYENFKWNTFEDVEDIRYEYSEELRINDISWKTVDNKGIYLIYTLVGEDGFEFTKKYLVE